MKPQTIPETPSRSREDQPTLDHSTLKDRADQLNHEEKLRKLAEEEAAKRRASAD